MSWFRSTRKKQRNSRNHAARARLSVEHLERRDLLAVGPELLISEVHFKPGFGDPEEEQYLELRGTPGATVADGTYFVVVDGDGDVPTDSPGEITSVFDLSALELGANGFLVITQGGSAFTVDAQATLLTGTDGFGGLPDGRFQDDNTLANRFDFGLNSTTFLLVTAPVAPTPGDDVDADNDGVLDGAAANWIILDSVSVLGHDGNSAAADKSYGQIVFRTDGNASPVPQGATDVTLKTISYVARVGSSNGSTAQDWMAGRTDDITSGEYDFEVTFGIFGDPAPVPFAGRDLDHLGSTNFLSSIGGTKFHDTNLDGQLDDGEYGLEGFKVFLDRNGNGIRDSFRTVAEPDDFLDDTELTNAFPGVTLTIADELGLPIGFEVLSTENPSDATTGTRVFSHGGIAFFSESRQFRMDFYRPVWSVSIDFIGTVSDTIGRLEAYDANHNLLETFLTPAIVEEPVTMTVRRPSAEIAYALAYSDPSGSPFGDLDNLRFSQLEEWDVTDNNGDYQIDRISELLADDSIAVREIQRNGFQQTAPAGGRYNATLNGATALSGLDFGNEGEYVEGPEGIATDIVGRGNGIWWASRATEVGYFDIPLGEWSQSADWTDVLVGDFDGDGYDDIAGRNNGVWWLSRSTLQGFVTERWGQWSSRATWMDVLAADVNGDGLMDIVGRANGALWVARSTGSGFVNERWGGWSPTATWLDVQAGDFDGDGQHDIAGRANGNWWVARSTGSEFVNEKWGRWSPKSNWLDVQVADVNGDGSSDIVGRAAGTWWVAQSTGSEFLSETWGRWSTAVKWQDVHVGDFNGDGNTDIAGRARGNWWVARSTGSAFVNERWGRWSPTATWLDVQVADFNGDGTADIAGRANGTWWVALSTGSAFFNARRTRWSTSVAWHDVAVGHFGGRDPDITARSPASGGGSQSNNNNSNNSNVRDPIDYPFDFGGFIT